MVQKSPCTPLMAVDTPQIPAVLEGWDRHSVESSSPKPCLSAHIHPRPSLPQPSTSPWLMAFLHQFCLNQPRFIPSRKLLLAFTRSPSQHPLFLGAYPQLLLDLEGARPSHRVGNHISRQRHRLAGQAWGIAKPFSTACECRVRLEVPSQRAGDLLGILVLSSQWSRTPNPTGGLA